MKVVPRPKRHESRRQSTGTRPSAWRRWPASYLFPYAGWAAYFSAGTFVIGMLLLILGGVLAPEGTQFFPLLRLPFFVRYLALLPVALALHHLGRWYAPWLSWLALSSGLIGLSTVLLRPFLASWAVSILGSWSVHSQVAISVLQNAVPTSALALWLVLTHFLTWQSVPRQLAWLGLTVGVGKLLTLPSAFLPILTLQASSEPAALPMIWEHPLFLVNTVGGLFLLLGYPIWAIWIGRWLMSVNVTATE